MKQMNFWNKARNKFNTQQLANTLADKEDRTFLRGGVTKNAYANNNTQEPYAEYKYTRSYRADNDGDTSGGQQASLTEGLDTMNSVKGFVGKFGGGSGAGAGSGSGSGGGTPWGAIAGVAREGYDTIMDKDGTEYSDLEQSTIYPVQGAAIGSQFGPWGAAGGALYGLGYSFKDDIGLKDNDWLTTVLFPIGMGDEHQGLIQL